MAATAGEERGDDVPGSAARRWARVPQVQRELRKSKMSRHEAGRLKDLMDRYLEGRSLSADHKKLRDGVHELRLDGDGRIFRLYFAHEAGGDVLLALHFAGKKAQRDPAAIDLAIARLKDWRNNR